MEYRLEEQIRPDLNYYRGEDPLERLESEGWELLQLIPEYNLVECDPPRNQAEPGTAKNSKITGKLQISNFVGLFRREG